MHNRSVGLFLALSSIVPFTATLAQTNVTPPTNEAMRHYRTLGDPRLSPDGKHALVQVRESAADGAKRHLWLVPVDGGEARQITYSPDSDKGGESGGQWMPDGKSILFLAHRGEHSTLFRLPMSGGEAEPLEIKVTPVADASSLPDAVPPAKPETTPKPDAGPKPAEKPEDLAVDIANYRVSPDGKWIAFTAADPETPGEKRQSDAKADAVWVDHDLHLTRLYLFDLATAKVTPVAVPGDVEDIAWSRDGLHLAAVANAPNNLDDLGPAKSAWLVQTDSPQKPTRLTQLPPTVGSLEFSFDGRSLVYLAQAERDTPPGYEDLYLCGLDSKPHNLSDGFDGSIVGRAPFALQDGSMLQMVETGTSVTLARFSPSSSPASTKPPELVHLPTSYAGGMVTNLKQSGWLFLGSSGGQPTRLFYAEQPGGPARTLATPALVPANTRSIAPRRIEWQNEGLTIQGLLYLPPEAAKGKVPLIVEVHGGPLGAYADAFEPFADFLLGHGWAVLRPNPRGSTGRGAAFAAANKNDLGGADYRDIMAGVDFVLKAEPIDPAKMALMGYSYGGEMAGFVEGKTDRFKAIVSGAPVIDQYSEYGTESGSWYDRWYFGKPWEHPSDAWRQSPLSGVAHAKTPFLLLQGQEDSTDPLGQSQEMYRALRQMGVPVDLVTYPRDNHGPLAGALYGYPVPEPWHGFDARQRVVSFIEKAFK